MHSVRILTRVYRIVAYLAVASLLCAMMVTVADVSLRRSVNLPIQGTIDLVQLFVVAAAYLSIPYAFMVDGHVSVDLLANKMPARVQSFLRFFGLVLGIGVMTLIGYYAWQQALIKMEAGDVSQNLSIPVIYYWAPLIVGSALAVLGSVVLAAALFVHALVGGPDPGFVHDEPVV